MRPAPGHASPSTGPGARDHGPRLRQPAQAAAVGSDYLDFCPRTLLIVGLTLGALVLATAAQTWEPGRWQEMTRDALLARQRGDKDRAERICIEVRRYVDTNAVQSLDDYASLLKTLNRENAGAAQARADQLREVKKSQSKSTFLGWTPSNELRAYAALLRETGRLADAAAIEVLADAYYRVQYTNYLRQQEESRGEDSRGEC